MKKKFSYKRFSMFIVSILLVGLLFVSNTANVKYNTYKAIGKVFGNGNEVVVTLVKSDNDEGGSFLVSGQTLRYRQTYHIEEVEHNNDYFINVRKSSDDSVIAIGSEPYEVTLTEGEEYYLSLETDNNIDPTDVCFDAGGGCLNLFEVPSYKENTRRSDSDGFVFDENVTVTVRMKNDCDRLATGCLVNNLNIKMQNDGEEEINSEMVPRYFGMVNYRLLDNNGNLIERDNAEGQTSSELYNVSLEDVSKVNVSLTLFDNEENPIANCEDLRIYRLYRNPSDQIIVREVRIEDTLEYQNSNDKEHFNYRDALAHGGLTFNVLFELDNEEVTPYAIVVTGFLTGYVDLHGGEEQSVNVRFNVRESGSINEGREFVYRFDNEEVTLSFTDPNLSVDGDSVHIDYQNLQDFTLNIEGFNPETMAVTGHVPDNGFTTELLVSGNILYLRPADSQTILPGDMSNLDIEIMSRNGNEHHYVQEKTITLEGVRNGQVATINVNNTNVTMELLSGNNPVELVENNPYTVTINKTTIKDPEGHDVEVDYETMNEIVRINNLDLKTMDVWAYDEIEMHFQKKLTSLNNEDITFEKVGEKEYLITIKNSQNFLPHNLAIAVTEKYEYPENMPNRINISIQGENVSPIVNDEDKTVTIPVGNSNVVLTLNGYEGGFFGDEHHAGMTVLKEELENISFDLTGFDKDNMFVSYDMNGARGLVKVVDNQIDLSSLVLSDRIDLIFSTQAEGFDGNAYFAWDCNNKVCYHKVSDIAGRTFLTNSKGMVILDDMGQPYQTYPTNYFSVNELTDESENHVNFSTTLENHNNDINDHFANWILARNVENANKEYIGTYSTVFGNGEDHGYQLDPTGGISGQSSFGSNGDRNFRATVYVEGEYEAVTFEASPLKYVYFPGFWNPVFFNETRDISGTTKEHPQEYETYLLEPQIVFTTGVHSKSPIVDVKALDINSKAVTITNENGVFTVVFNSNYYDNVLFELTDQAGEKYYLNITRTLAYANYDENRSLAFFELYHPIDYLPEDFEVVATLNMNDGSTITKVLESTDLVSLDTNFEISGSYSSGGKNLFYSQYNIDFNKENINKDAVNEINYTVVIKNALNNANTYGGTFAGSGKGITLHMHGE